MIAPTSEPTSLVADIATAVQAEPPDEDAQLAAIDFDNGKSLLRRSAQYAMIDLYCAIVQMMRQLCTNVQRGTHSAQLTWPGDVSKILIRRLRQNRLNCLNQLIVKRLRYWQIRLHLSIVRLARGSFL